MGRLYHRGRTLQGKLSYQETVKWLYDLSKKERSGMRLGLDSVTGLCKRVNDPQDSYRAIHVAGTNGKGSVSHMVEAVLRTSRCRTGLYTSPHLQTFCERIIANGDMITEEEMVAIGQELLPHVEDMGFGPTFFDVTTTMAFMHFRNIEVERAVVEVGLGGRLDSTNVLHKVDVCAITSIGLEHTNVLGKDIPSITMEKASIIKPGSIVVVGNLPAEGVPIVNRMADERKAKEVRGMADMEVLDHSIDGLRCRVSGRNSEYKFTMPVLGRHQALNAAVAIAALEALDDPPKRAEVETGLSEVEVPGRMEIVDHGPLVMIDGGHNPAAGAEVAATMDELFPDKEIVLVIGMMKDKDVGSFLGNLSGRVSSVVATKAMSERAVPPHRLEEGAKGRCQNVSGAENIKDAMDMAVDIAGKDGVVLVTGSFYLAGEARQMFKPVRHNI